jgi:hypothetical protein
MPANEFYRKDEPMKLANCPGFLHSPSQRILGQLIKEGQEKGEIRDQKTNAKKVFDSTPPQTLSEVGITAKQSSRFQRESTF